jgi:hypothetical protein
MLKRLSLAVLFSLAAACGSPEAGDACSPENAATCGDNTTALICEGSVLKAFNCRGPSGCISNSTAASCDFSASRAGEACPKINDTKALCDVSNANSALVCTNGMWTARTCNSCAVQAGSVVCKP